MMNSLVILNIRNLFLILALNAGAFFFPTIGHADIFSIEGNHPTLGNYRGEIEFRINKNSSKELDVIRIVRFERFLFEGFNVEEVWVGKGTKINGSIQVIYYLKQADFLSRLDQLRRSKKQFQEPIRVKQSIQGLGAANVMDIVLPSGRLRERFTGKKRKSRKTPIWRDQRMAIESYGRSHPNLGKIAMLTMFRPLMRSYHRDPFVSRFHHRPEYKSKKQYFVLDPTDFKYLRANSNSIRVVNKVMDEISLFEALLRRNAYAPTLEKKASIFTHEIVKHNLNDLGLLEIGVVKPETNRRVTAFPNGDAALWTGMFAGSQAMRYKITGEKEALALFRRVLQGLILLMDVTPDKSKFARTVRRVEAGEPLPPGNNWRRGQGAYAGIGYMVGGNNDMIKGLFHAFTWALLVLPEGDSLRDQVMNRAKRMTNLSVAKRVNHPGNSLLAAGLRAVATGEKSWLDRYLFLSEQVISAIAPTKLDRGMYYGGIADWSGVNLGVVARVTHILVAEQLNKRFASSGDFSRWPGSVSSRLSRALQNRRKELAEMAKVYGGARQDIVTFAAIAFKACLPNATIGNNNPCAASPFWMRDVQTAKWSLREIPISGRVQHSYEFDFSLKSDWSISAWPRLPWKYLGGEHDMKYFYQGAYDYPNFESDGLFSDNVWTSAFNFRGGGGTNVRHARIDFLFPFWMSRF